MWDLEKGRVTQINKFRVRKEKKPKLTNQI